MGGRRADRSTKGIEEVITKSVTREVALLEHLGNLLFEEI